MFNRKRLPPPLPPSSRRQVTPPAPTPGLSPGQVRPIDWEAEDEARLPLAKPVTSYVPAASELMRTPSVHLASPDAHVDANIVPASVVEARIQGTHVDRASAWLRYSLPLSVVAALVVTIAAHSLQAFPLLSWSALVTLGVTFMAVYALLLFRYWETSPEGVALYHTKQLWKLFHREQKYRHQIEAQEWQQRRKMVADHHNDDRRARRGR
jgi:hypothetical protein